MDFSKIPNINDGDFYKFIASSSLIIVFGGIWIISKYQEKIINGKNIILVLIIFIFLCSFFWAMKEWGKKQKKLDKQLENDISLKKALYEKTLDEIVKARGNDSIVKKLLNKPFSQNSLNLSDCTREQINKEIKRK